MLEKILNKVPKIATIIVATGMVYGCGELCEAPAYNNQSMTETQMSALTEEQGVVEELETKGFYLMATCRPGCTYDDEVGCCWCPD